ncbi:MAG: YceI family protein [Flavobacteriaceae bacterium]|nr:YceI family protein [Flavobacteriaceae bacterium]
MKKTLLSFVIILLSIISCKKPAKETTHLMTADSLSSPSGEYKLDISQSIVNWTGYKIEKSLNLNHFGTLSFREGTLNFKYSRLDSGILIVEVSSLKDEDEENPGLNQKLTEHLKSKDFLDVNTYPTAVFTITSSRNIEGISDFNTELKGVLNLKNRTKNISVRANVRIEKNTLHLHTEKFSLNRQDFGITYEGISPILITDDFDLQISILAHLK